MLDFQSLVREPSTCTLANIYLYRIESLVHQIIQEYVCAKFTFSFFPIWSVFVSEDQSVAPGAFRTNCQIYSSYTFCVFRLMRNRPSVHTIM